MSRGDELHVQARESRDLPDRTPDDLISEGRLP